MPMKDNLPRAQNEPEQEIVIRFNDPVFTMPSSEDLLRWFGTLNTVNSSDFGYSYSDVIKVPKKPRKKETDPTSKYKGTSKRERLHNLGDRNAPSLNNLRPGYRFKG